MITSQEQLSLDTRDSAINRLRAAALLLHQVQSWIPFRALHRSSLALDKLPL